ncbi:MAG TPA: RNA polymerase sigma factor, partial [Thermoleophilia bacterium]|nr:RNA polymerase sigma factor [Thermoleophilia bacterium]
MGVHDVHRSPDELETAYRDLRPSLVRYAESMLDSSADAEDVVQEAFLAAGRSGPIDELRPWLFRVTRNAVISSLRKRRENVGLDQVAEPIEPRTPSVEAELGQQLATLRACIERLPERRRSALMMRELGGLSYGEIAAAISTSEANVKVLVFRARKDVADLWDGAGIDCEAAQLAISQQLDGELEWRRAARAAVHAATCRHCRRFSAAVSMQRRDIAAAYPLIGAGHVGVLAAHAAGGKAAAGGGAILQKATAVLAAVVLTAGSAAILRSHGVQLSDLFGHRSTFTSAAPSEAWRPPIPSEPHLHPSGPAPEAPSTRSTRGAVDAVVRVSDESATDTSDGSNDGSADGEGQDSPATSPPPPAAPDGTPHR